MRFTADQLKRFIRIMKDKEKPEDQPGWLHYRVFGDYIRESVSKKHVNYHDLGLSGEIELMWLELECAKKAFQMGFNSFVEQGLIKALEDKIKKLTGVWLTQAQNDNIEAFFPDETDNKVA